MSAFCQLLEVHADTFRPEVEMIDTGKRQYTPTIMTAASSVIRHRVFVNLDNIERIFLSCSLYTGSESISSSLYFEGVARTTNPM